MCHVSNFLCGCADLRRGALIIGITKLVNLTQFFQFRKKLSCEIIIIPLKVISCSITIFAIYLIVEGAIASKADCQVSSLTYMYELLLL